MSGLRQIATEPANLDLRASEKMDRSPHLRHHTKSQGGVSDSELSTETNSLSAESNNDNGRSPVKSTPSGGAESQASKSKQRRKGAEWEVIDSFKTLKIFDQAPAQLEGFMLKKRKWPLKGWHKVWRLQLYLKPTIYNEMTACSTEIFHSGEGQFDVRKETHRFGPWKTTWICRPGPLLYFCKTSPVPDRHRRWSLYFPYQGSGSAHTFDVCRDFSHLSFQDLVIFSYQSITNRFSRILEGLSQIPVEYSVSFFLSNQFIIAH